MKTKSKRKIPQIVLRGGKPAAVILDIDEYRSMLERLEPSPSSITVWGQVLACPEKLSFTSG